MYRGREYGSLADFSGLDSGGPLLLDSMAAGLQRIHNEILRVLKQHGLGKPIALIKIDASLPADLRDQSDLPRRIRELKSRGGYEIVNHRRGSDSFYTLKSLDQREQRASSDGIPGKTRAKILLQANGRCQMTGKTIKDDGIKLVIDHRVPREWGGTSHEDNLWAICEEMNIAKRHFCATLPKSVMQKCMGFDDPTQRIGELLKAFDGKFVPRWLLEIVGMDDEWTRRLRELRDLGWRVDSVRAKGERGRHKFVYKLVESKPWPSDVRAAIQAAAAKRGSKSL